MRVWQGGPPILCSANEEADEITVSAPFQFGAHPHARAGSVADGLSSAKRLVTEVMG